MSQSNEPSDRAILPSSDIAMWQCQIVSGHQLDANTLARNAFTSATNAFHAASLAP